MAKNIIITESQFHKLFEHIAVIDNTSDAEKLISMQWTSPDDYWFIQITQRKKDFRNFNKRHGGNTKWWDRVPGIDGSSRENFVGYGVVKGNSVQEAIDSLRSITIKLNPWAAQKMGQTSVQSNGNMEAIYDICRSQLDVNTPNYNNLNRLIS